MFASLRSMWTQFFPPPPTFTEEHVPSQHGRVFIVTGGNTGIGFELCKMLYPTGATIYMAARSQSRAEEAIQQITSAGPASGTGSLKFLLLDLDDLRGVARAADAFARLENRLDVLWNNAGPGPKTVAAGAKTAQGLEPMMGTHCVATLLFTLRLLPLLRAAAAAAATPGATPGATRVAWTTSYLAEGQSPRHGLSLATLHDGTADRVRNYAMAKAGVWMLARELAARPDAAAVRSVVLNPGNVRAGSYAGHSAAAMLLRKPLLHETRAAAYTHLFAGLAPDVARAGADGGGCCYVVPWGRLRPDADCPRPDLLRAMKSDEEGGLGYGKELWEWCEEQWKDL